ncbi:alpha-L-fucosidase 2-like isoform X3 [Camellia sinensis]|uniref:alpha-L-fucosidase 2-like isoform X3 n=1 Tax=Camellia sinensis TaxID=4442 RepID=UPI0010365871|nr:alpha-L-fucosidase 2-like isoform X3 [Camellia sinensis]
MADDDWLMVGRPGMKDLWEPSLLEEEASRPLEVRFGGPAKHWTDALPIGNGRLGAMVWGGVQSETLNLNEDTLWTGIPGNYTNPDAPKSLSVVRKLVDDGQYSEATTEAVKLLDNPSAAYQLLGDIKLEFDDSHASYSEETYSRVLDLDTATTKVKYSVGEVEFVREHFASNPDQVIVTKISGSKSGSLSFTVSIDSKLQHHSSVNGKNQIIMEGSCPGYPKGIQFSAILDLQISDVGTIYLLDDKKLKIEGSDWVVMLLVASSSFDGPFTKPSDSKKDPTSESLSTLNLIKNLSYADLHSRHLDDYQKLFHRVSLQLSKSSKNVGENGRLDRNKNLSSATDLCLESNEAKTVSTAERVKSFQTDEDPSLVELLFQYGRYLLISCSRPGTQVANLQGIWNKDIAPAWEMLQVNYEASGWVVHQVSDLWAKTSPDRGEAVWALWQMGGAWLCTHLWEHYTYTMDKGFLESKAYPFLEGCASFLLDWLIEGRGGYLETNPSTSPEHTFIAPDGKPASVSYSTTMDMSIIKEVFSAVVSAAQALGKSDDDLVDRVRKAQPRLYPTKIARDGSIMEWAQDFEDPDPHHRHLSHLFGLFPGHTITVEKTPDLCKAANSTLYKRGEEGPGWSTVWKTALWARLLDSEHAYRLVKHLFNLVDPDHESDFEGGLYSNLFTAHPPFQIDANFGFSAAIAEMLLQSTVKDLYLLPALPRDKWANGCVKGLKARGGVTVNICWNEGNLHEVGLWSKNQNSIRLHFGGITVAVKMSSATVYTFNNQLKCVKTYSLLDMAFL